MKTVESLLELGEFDATEWYPLAEQAALDAGWSDPAMNIYDDYDANRQ